MTSPDNERGNGWTNVRLRFVAEVNPLAPPRSILTDDTLVSFLPMEAIGEDGSLRLETDRPVAELRAGYSYFADGDVAFAKVTPCFENGKGALMRGLTRGAGFGTTEVTVLRPGPNLQAGFLNFFVNSLVFRQPGAGAMQGAGGLKRVPDEFTRNSVLPLPPVQVQRSVVDFLDRETARIDGLIEKKTRFIELLHEKRQALITQAVTRGLDPSVPVQDSGVDWLAPVPAHWKVTQLKHVVDPNSSITYGIVQAGPEHEGGIPYIKTSDMSGDELPVAGYSRTSPEIEAGYARSRVRPGDIVISIRASIGKCLPVPPTLSLANLTQGTAKITPGADMNMDFLLAYLASNTAQTYFALMAKGATFKEITLDALRRTPVVQPPLSEQRQIAEYIKSAGQRLDRLMHRTSRSVDLLTERRAALITAAVTGQIDVREAA